MLKQYIDDGNYETSDICVSSPDTTPTQTSIKNVSRHFVAFTKESVGFADYVFYKQTTDISQDNIAFVLAPGESRCVSNSCHVDALELQKLDQAISGWAGVSKKFVDTCSDLKNRINDIAEVFDEKEFPDKMQASLDNLLFIFHGIESDIEDIYVKHIGDDCDAMKHSSFTPLNNSDSFPDTEEANEMLERWLKEHGEHKEE